MGWLNGSLYHELHGREDGRSRTYIFGQMGLLVLLSVYDAADGRGFAIVYAILLALIGVQWFGIRRYDTPEMGALTARYVAGVAVVGVADGLAEADRSARTIVTGLLALGIGFGFWWKHFDFVGRREPRPGVAARTLWMNGQFPLSLSIAAAGAGMVSLVGTPPTPAPRSLPRG